MTDQHKLVRDNEVEEKRYVVFKINYQLKNLKVNIRCNYGQKQVFLDMSLPEQYSLCKTA